MTHSAYAVDGHHYDIIAGVPAPEESHEAATREITKMQYQRPSLGQPVTVIMQSTKQTEFWCQSHQYMIFVVLLVCMV